MAEYDFKDVAAFKGVWVFCEQRGGEIMPTDEELISRARILADELGEEVVGLTLGGKGIAEKAKVLGGYGAGLTDQCRVPGTCLCQRNRVDGTESVYDIVAEDHWYAEA